MERCVLALLRPRAGFVLGYLGARLRNWSMTAYAFVLKRYAEAGLAHPSWIRSNHGR